MVGSAATQQASRPDEELIPYILSEMENVHPGIREHAEGAVVKAWGRDPYAAGPR